MKRLLLIFIFLSLGFEYAQFANTPQYEFKSTSSYQITDHTHQYTIPVSEIQQPFSSQSPQNNVIRRSPDYPPADPRWENETPVGDAMIPLLIISLLYCLYIKVYNIQSKIKNGSQLREPFLIYLITMQK